MRVVPFKEYQSPGGVDQFFRLWIILEVSRHFARRRHPVVAHLRKNLFDGSRARRFEGQRFEQIDPDAFSAGPVAAKQREEGGRTLEDFLEEFPPVTREQAEAVLDASQGSLYEALRAEARQKELAHLKGLILDGVNSGEATPMTEDDWREIRTEVGRRAEERAGNKTQ